MQNNFSYAQIRKGDPIAQMSSAQNRNTMTQNTGQFVGYRLNTRIRTLRIAKGWSQTQLGEKLAELMGNDKKIPTSTIASWEHKDAAIAKIPAPDKVIALSNLFNVTVDYLKGFSDDPKKSAMVYKILKFFPKNLRNIWENLFGYLVNNITVGCF